MYSNSTIKCVSPYNNGNMMEIYIVCMLYIYISI